MPTGDGILFAGHSLNNEYCEKAVGRNFSTHVYSSETDESVSIFTIEIRQLRAGTARALLRIEMQ